MKRLFWKRRALNAAWWILCPLVMPAMLLYALVYAPMQWIEDQLSDVNAELYREFCKRFHKEPQ